MGPLALSGPSWEPSHRFLQREANSHTKNKSLANASLYMAEAKLGLKCLQRVNGNLTFLNPSYPFQHHNIEVKSLEFVRFTQEVTNTVTHQSIHRYVGEIHMTFNTWEDCSQSQGHREFLS